MELKVLIFHLHLVTVHGFNRTFMELKVVIFAQFYIVLNKFQSHLYGIERWRNLLWQSNPTLFQSHLYGIESDVTVVGKCERPVSIAPLWN